MGAASLRVICGPTAAGKSALVMALAERVPLTVISADSRQIYRGFDIGTAKPSAADRARVPHRGIDVVEPTERYSAGRWAEGARRWIAEAERAGRVPVVVGGTGFYVRALVAPLFDEPALDTARRRAHERELERLPTSELRRWCERLDPPRAHLGRAQLLRAALIALLTGVPLSAWHARAGRAPGRQARYLVVDPGGSLRERIAHRTAGMLAAGWEAEAAALAERVPPDAPAWNATGYAIIRSLVLGEMARDDAIARIEAGTRQYAKRQRTWIRHQLPAGDVTALDPARGGALARAMSWWCAEPEDEGRG